MDFCSGRAFDGTWMVEGLYRALNATRLAKAFCRCEGDALFAVFSFFNIVICCGRVNSSYPVISTVSVAKDEITVLPLA